MAEACGKRQKKGYIFRGKEQDKYNKRMGGHMEILKGEGFPWCGGVAVGRLCFTQKAMERDREAILWVCTSYPTNLPSSSVVGVVVVDGAGQSVPMAPFVNGPVLSIPCLKPELEGRIAILDSYRGALFVSPDLETLKAYGSQGALPSEEMRPPTFYRHVREIPRERHGEDGWLWEDDAAEEEDILFARYRAAAETHPGVPLVICASLGNVHRLRGQLRAVYRGAVFGRFSLLFCGISTYGEWLSCLRICHEIFCDMESEGREFNGYLPRGILLDRGMTLLESFDTCRPDFLCVEGGGLFRSLCGTEEVTADRIRLLGDALERAFDREKLWLWVRACEDLSICRRLTREGGLCPRGWIAP